MGDPKKTRKKYVTPAHPWQKQRIVDENVLMKEFGLKNKKELWKMGTFVKVVAKQAKKAIASKDEQSRKEEKQLLSKLARLGLVASNAKIDDALGLTIRNVLERRLQTLVFKKNLARSVNQARQFITHRHIKIKGKKVTSPSFLVDLSDESTIGFAQNSQLFDEQHPERVPPLAIAETNEEEKVLEKKNAGDKK